jgi:DNA polymerase V
LASAFGQLKKPDYEQISLFMDDKTRRERQSLDRAMDAIKGLYGKNSVLRCSSLLDSSTIKQRHEQIGGHRQ